MKRTTIFACGVLIALAGCGSEASASGTSASSLAAQEPSRAASAAPEQVEATGEPEAAAAEPGSEEGGSESELAQNIEPRPPLFVVLSEGEPLRSEAREIDGAERQIRRRIGELERIEIAEADRAAVRSWFQPEGLVVGNANVPVAYRGAPIIVAIEIAAPVRNRRGRRVSQGVTGLAVFRPDQPSTGFVSAGPAGIYVSSYIEEFELAPVAAAILATREGDAS